MNEPIDCWVCDRPGLLLLNALSVEHPQGIGRKSVFCELPPRDVAHPNAQRAHGRTRYPSPYRQRVAS